MRKQRKIIRIDLVFENCEVAHLETKDFNYFSLFGIKRCISNCNGYELLEMNISSQLFIRFEDLKSVTYPGFSETPKSLYGRLKNCSDVTHVDIIYDDGSSDYIGVAWGGSNHFFNAHQIIKYRKYPSGERLYLLVIARKWTLYKIIRYLLFQIKNNLYYKPKKYFFWKRMRKPPKKWRLGVIQIFRFLWR